MRKKKKKAGLCNFFFLLFIANSQNIYTKLGIFLQTASVLPKASCWLHKLSGSSNSYLCDIIKASEAPTNAMICPGCPAGGWQSPKEPFSLTPTPTPEPVCPSPPRRRTGIQQCSRDSSDTGNVPIRGTENWPDGGVSAGKRRRCSDVEVLWKSSAADETLRL